MMLRRRAPARREILCGVKEVVFRDANYLKNLFRKRTGMSMREWRRHGDE